MVSATTDARLLALQVAGRVGARGWFETPLEVDVCDVASSHALDDILFEEGPVGLQHLSRFLVQWVLGVRFLR